MVSNSIPKASISESWSVRLKSRPKSSVSRYSEISHWGDFGCTKQAKDLFSIMASPQRFPIRSKHNTEDRFQ